MPSTIYDIRLRYTLDDKAGKGLDGIGAKADRASSRVGGLGSVLGKLGAIAASGFGIQQAGKHLIGFNANVQDTKLQIAGMMSVAKGTDLSKELATADRVFANLQKRAATLPGTTQEYTRFAGMITQPLVDAGMATKDLEDMTVSAVVAAKALGEQAEVAARDISQVLRGQFHSTDPFAGKVLGAIGYKGEDGRKKFNEMSAEMRASELRRALGMRQWAQLAAAQGQTFNGVLSTFQDNLQQLLGKVGLPLFKAITAELTEWNAWAEANSGKLTEWAKDFGQGLVDGFRMVKDALSFMVDHKDDLILIAKMWLAASVGNGIAGMLGGVGGLSGAFTKNLHTMGSAAGMRGLGGIGKGMMGDAVGIGGAVLGNAGAVAAAGVVGWEIGTWLDEKTGLSSSIATTLARWTGKWDDAAEAQEKQLKKLTDSMDAMDTAINNRVKQANDSKVGGARATQGYANLMGMSDYRKAEANKIRADLKGVQGARAWAARAGDQDSSLFNPRITASVAKREAEAAAEENRSKNLQNRGNIAASHTDAMLAIAMSKLTDAQRRAIDMSATTQEVMTAAIRSMIQVQPDYGGWMNQMMGVTAPGKIQMLTYEQVLNIIQAVNGFDPRAPKGDQKAPGKVNVTIQRIEVKSEDPDRFAFGMVEAFRDVAKNPSGAMAAIREG